MMNIGVGSESSLLAITYSTGPPPPLGVLEWRMGLYLCLISAQILFPRSYLQTIASIHSVEFNQGCYVFFFLYSWW